MITCKKANEVWLIQGEIKMIQDLHGSGARVGIEDLNLLLSDHVGRQALITVELDQPIDHRQHFRTVGAMPKWVELLVNSGDATWYDPFCDLWFVLRVNSNTHEELKRPK